MNYEETTEPLSVTTSRPKGSRFCMPGLEGWAAAMIGGEQAAVVADGWRRMIDGECSSRARRVAGQAKGRRSQGRKERVAGRAVVEFGGPARLSTGVVKPIWTPTAQQPTSMGR